MPKQTRNSQSSNPPLTPPKILATAELAFAAFIKAKYRLPLVDIKRSGTGRVSWSFALPQDKDEPTLANEFWRGGQVSASEYFMELKNLKSTTYAV